MVTYEFIPSGFVGEWEGKLVNKIIEKYLEDTWTEDDTPKKSEIKFGYILEQNISELKVTLALKCMDNGQKIIDKGTNYASCIYVNDVTVHIEGRKISDNYARDYPIGLEQVKLKVLNIINSDPLALKDTEGIHKLSIDVTDPVYPIKDKPNWFYLDIHVTVTRFMSKIILP
jgi:hypothetical protein